jgi:hypothetical protein
VDACPTLALKFMDEAAAKNLIANSEVWKAELKDKLKPRVYYQNVPGKFIAGTLYDPVEEEVIIGAVATLTKSGGNTLTVETDNYGDFWFEGLDKGVYDLELKSNGKVKAFAGLDTTEKDLNLGDIPLT